MFLITEQIFFLNDNNAEDVRTQAWIDNLIYSW